MTREKGMRPAYTLEFKPGGGTSGARRTNQCGLRCTQILIEPTGTLPE